MNRKEFIKTCGFACAGTLVFGSVFQSCSSVKMISGIIENDIIIVKLSDFIISKDNSFRKYVIIQNEKLNFPISVYRINDTQYSALWMQCTHQGNELTAFGDRLQCSAHGSEFDKNGNVTNGPASNRLKTFPVVKEKELLKISLKTV
ncbi:QcrA and Rieske domain-containing protein [Changchengzhania lutea]|uniref:QcrA and Rieske domain-containing protein n=1 Tax=Changchengzhania lutea TaxID=2049305 RepID=UPI00115E00DD|nr:Rieske (2Fe-2S) protein [Changchengzhania lutea]